jgi:two-component system chemotaxis sensor kinase CheA
MDNRDEEFLKRINETFRIEAEEHLNAFSAGLIDLEKTQSQERYAELIETMFREIHSLKGAARSVDQKDVESLCQPLEGVFSAFKHRDFTMSPSSFDLFYKTITCLSVLISESGSERTAADRQLQRELITQLKEITAVKMITGQIEKPKHNTEQESESEPEPEPQNDIHTTQTGAKPRSSNAKRKTRNVQRKTQNDKHETDTIESIPVSATDNLAVYDIPKSAKPLSADTVRILVSKLDPLFLQAEELIQSKKAINQRINELQEINSCIAGCKTQSLKWKDHRSMGSPALWNEWSEGNDTNLNRLENQLAELTRSMERDQYSLYSMVDSHLESMRQVLMLPVSSITEAFPGMVREISREQKKEIEFVIEGAELEIDKRILDELKDPLIHLLRNSIDHGISKPQERISRNKPAQGTIILAFTARESGIFEITLSDDGNGINMESVLKAAIKSRILSGDAAEKLDPGEVLSLIYKSGISTSSIITDISGRGLGLSIVHEKVEKLNGKISVDTGINKGTIFHILLPMTLATFRGILVRIAEFLFILPTINVEMVMKADPEKIKTVNNHDTILIDEKVLSLSDLGAVLGLPEHKHTGSGKMEPGMESSNQIRIVVLVSGDHRIAFRVDEVIDEQQVLVKGLGKLLKRVRNISGATILGSGKVVPVLHIPDLIKSALISAGKPKMKLSLEKTDEVIKKILVADDSITSRTLIKNILETAGYKVITAVDGTDAFTQARSNEFDLIVSDVDMPRMNGFELIAKIRHDKKLSEVPVVLVTALGSREDHERGIEVGADAYIIKSNFDQTNLLEIIKKLI